MLKHLKSVGMLLFLSTISGGAVYASSGERVTGIDAVQQNGTCTGVVKDGTGETVIGASVVVKGTTNGTITGIDGDFSLNNVKQGDIIQISFVGYKTVEASKMEWSASKRYIKRRHGNVGRGCSYRLRWQTITYQSN